MTYLSKIGAGCLALAAGLAIGLGSGCSESDEPASEVGFTPAPLTMRRLLARHYVNTIGEVFGAEAAAVATPPADTAINGFKSIAAAQLAMTDGLVSDYESSARSVATVAGSKMSLIDGLAGCHPQRPDDAECMAKLVARLGKRLFRRPLTTDEQVNYAQRAQEVASETRDFYTGVRIIIMAMLQSPNFLFQIELGSGAADEPGMRKLTAYELAARMSFLLLDRAPDETLLAAVDAGELDSEEGIRAVANEMLTQGDASKAVMAFFREYLMLEDLGTLAKDPNMFPAFNPELASSMERETLKLINDVVFVRDAPIGELFTSPYTFVDKRLAPIYQVPAPESATWHRVDLPPEQGRVGILGHASILSRQAHPTSTSATYRGLFIMERFLCTSMPPPPDDVVTDLPPSSTAPTLRERLAVHLDEIPCRGCHFTSDNLGLALETFDGIGQFREKENGALIDTTGTIDELGDYDGLASLAPLLANSEIVSQCLVRQVLRHASGHVESNGEMPAIRELHARFRDGGYRYRQLLVELVASPLFRTFAFPSAAESSEKKEAQR